MAAVLAEKSALLVHATDPDEEKVKACRRALAAHALYGRISADHRAPASLPYADRLADVVVALDAPDLPDGELTRVLVPGGALWMGRGGSWEMRRAPMLNSQTGTPSLATARWRPLRACGGSPDPPTMARRNGCTTWKP